MFGVHIPGIPGQLRGFKKPRVILRMTQQKLAAETHGPVNVNWSTNPRNQKQVGDIEYGQLCV